MPREGVADHGDAVGDKGLFEGNCAELGGIVDGDLLAVGVVTKGNGAGDAI